MRLTDFHSSGKPIAAGVAQTISFTSNEVPADKIIAYHIVGAPTAGSGNTLLAIDRIKVKANGVPIWDVSPAQHRAMIQNQTSGAVAYPANQYIGAIDAPGTPVDWRRFSIPFCILDRDLAPTQDLQDTCQFPLNSSCTIEIVFNNTAVAGALYCGWTETDQTALCTPRFYGTPMSIALSSPNAKFALSEEGVIRGLTVETTGLARFRAVLQGQQVHHSLGQLNDSTTITGDSMLHEMSQLFGEGTPAIIAGTTARANYCDDPRYVPMGTPMSASQGRSYVELATTASWSGSNSELGIHSIIAYQRGRG